MKFQLNDDTVRLVQIDWTEAGSREWRNQLSAALNGKRRNIEVDLSSLATIDSRGLGALVTLHQTASRHRGTCRLLNPSPPVQQILELARMNTVFQVVPEEAEAA